MHDLFLLSYINRNRECVCNFLIHFPTFFPSAVSLVVAILPALPGTAPENENKCGISAIRLVVTYTEKRGREKEEKKKEERERERQKEREKRGNVERICSW